ncbi:GNAT family N-acetyltransferase [Roseibium album]|uniref:GNAT family N-acetyltransferase n=1 Tax=Roseibium album TaxID=311410 RepID=UPI002492E0A0|nr:GNAT family N-acetyltransferase [Roseibium album]
MPLKLRSATPADALDLTGILHRAKASWGYPEAKMTEFMEAWSIHETTIRALEMTVAEQDGIPLAFSGVTKEGEDTLLVDFLFVDPEAQGQGIGNLLLKRAEDFARQKKLSRLSLESDFHAGAFYEKHGFRTMATRPSEMSPGKDIPLMEKVLPPCVHRVSKIDLTISDRPWRFEIENSAEIAEHFKEAQKRIALLWNGRTLKLTGYEFQNGIFSGHCSESSYAAHLAWRDWGAPDASAFNLFGSAIIRSSDGALLYGVMGGHTATAGMIYPPGGNLDLNDITPDGRVDVISAIDRELEEETGLTGETLTRAELLAAFDGPRISIAQVFDCTERADDLCQHMIEHSMASEEQELADIRIIRSRTDLEDPAIVPFAREIAEYLLPQ